MPGTPAQIAWGACIAWNGYHREEPWPSRPCTADVLNSAARVPHGTGPTPIEDATPLAQVKTSAMLDAGQGNPSGDDDYDLRVVEVGDIARYVTFRNDMLQSPTNPVWRKSECRGAEQFLLE